MAELEDGSGCWAGIHPKTVVGHVHLQVAHLLETFRFYTDLIGFRVQAGNHSAAFLSAGNYHHHLGLNTWIGRGAPTPPPSAAPVTRL